MKGLVLAAMTTLCSWPAQALSVPLTLNEQAKRAEIIIRAVVGAAKPLKEGDVTYLAYPLEIKETVAGSVESLPTQDGKPALLVLQGLEDAPKFTAGQETVLLLYSGRMDSPVVGVNQGAYPLDNGKVAAGEITDPAKLLEAIRTARGAK